MKKRFQVLFTIILLLFLTSCKDETTSPKKEEVKYEQNKENTQENTQEKRIVRTKKDSNNTVIVEFSMDINNLGDLNKKIRVTPEAKIESAIVSKNKLLIRGDFKTNTNYFCDLSSITENNKDVIKFSFKDKIEYIGFENHGILLPRGEKSLSLNTINVKKVNVKVYKIFQNNINTFVNNFDFTRGGDYYYDFNSKLDELGEMVYEAKTDVLGEKNKSNYVTLEFGKAFDKNGIYAIEVEGKSMTRDRRYPIIARKVMIMSDIGILVNRVPKMLDIRIVDIPTRRPLPNTKTYLMSKNNQIIDSSISDENGFVHFYNSLDKGYYLKVVNENDINILKLTDALPTNSFDVDGIKDMKGNQIYVYADRPEYRPGDEIHANIIIRHNGKPLDEGHPVKAIWNDANRNKEEIELKWNENSFYTLSKKIPQKGATGLWGLQIEAGSNSEYIEIPVEATVAKKLESSLIVPKKVSDDLLGKYKLNLESHYLYGNPSPNQIVKGTATFVLDNIKFINFEDFTFQLPNEKRVVEYPFEINLENGKADEEIVLVPKESRDMEKLPGSANMKIYWEAKVLDENGRPNPVYATTKVEKYKTFVGIKNYDDAYFPIGTTQKVPVVVVDKDGKRVENHRLKYTVYQKSSLFWYDFYSNDEKLSLKNDKSAQVIKEGELISSASKNSYINIPELSEGSVYVEVEDLETQQKSGTSYRISYWQDNLNFQEVSKLRMSSDKKSYEVGDVATIVWESNEDAYAYISFEKDGVIFKRMRKRIYGKEGKIDLPITEDMTPNVYVNVVLLQNYEEYTNDRPARLYGVLPIVVNDTKHNAKIKITTEEKIESKGDLIVDIENENNEPMEYVVSVIDLGLLQLKDYKIPDPHGYFFAKRAYQGSLYDNYTILLEKNRRETNTILEVGGGDFALAKNNQELKAVGALKEKMYGMENAERFKNLALYKGILKSDANGKLNVKFKMPRYQGAVKVIVTGVNRDLYGECDKNVVVTAPVIIQNSAPRTLKIGDEFTITSTLKRKNPKIEKGILSIEFENHMMEIPVDFTKQTEYTIKELFRANNEVGTKKIKINFKSDSYEDQEIINIDVNSVNPYTYQNKVYEVKPGEKLVVPKVENVIPGSDFTNIAVSTVKRYGIDKRLAELINYPYGCSEQITSTALAQLYLKELETTKVLDEEKVRDNINTTLLKLRNFKKIDGFSYWEFSNVNPPFDWLNNYIGEFIIRAREQGYYVDNSFYNSVVDMVVDSSYQNDNISQKVYALWLLSNIDETSMPELNYVRESMYNNLDLTDKWLVLSTYAKVGEVNFARKKAKNLQIFDEGKNARDIALRVEAYRSIYKELPKEYEDKLLKLLANTNSYNTYSIARIMMALVDSPKKYEEIRFVLDKENKVTDNGLYREKYIGSKEMTIENIGQEKLYVYTFWEGKSLDSKQEAMEQGIKITRSEMKEIYKQGEEINWTLTVAKGEHSSTNSLEEVAIVETLPSGFEWEIDRKNLEKTGVEHMDIRDDRIVLVIPYIGNNEVVIPLKARAITEGKYYFPGTLAEEMYDSNVRGQVENIVVEVK